MLYFSNPAGADEAKRLGVLSVVVKNGMRLNTLYYGLDRYSKVHTKRY